MNRKWITPVIYALIALAVFYVGIKLTTDTSAFLKMIIMTIGMAAVLYGAIYFFFLRNRTGSLGSRNEMKKYKQAVKQSKQKYKAPPVIKKSTTIKAQAKPSPFNQKKRKRPNVPHLRVIEGSKNKGKNRASF